MIIELKEQSFHVGQIDVVTISSSSNFQVGDNETVILQAIVEDAFDSTQIGPFATKPNFAQKFLRRDNEAAKNEK